MNDLTVSALSRISASEQNHQSQQLNVGYGASLSDIARFENSINTAIEKTTTVRRIDKPSETERAVMKPLDFINDEASEIVDYAKTAVASGNELTPSEIVLLTARTHQFMFHCQLTSNIANRTSDGLQQLFRQQS
jgi:23S rRNA-/tRNA-specific pseudouridylate synthase